MFGSAGRKGEHPSKKAKRGRDESQNKSNVKYKKLETTKHNS